MYVVRVYKDYNTKRNIGAKVVDEKTLEFTEVSWDGLTYAVQNDPNSIQNVGLDQYGKATLKNMNPSKKIKYYNQEYKSNVIINQYCIILGNNMGKMSFIADSTIGIHYNESATLGEIATILGINDISKLKLFNAYVEKENNSYSVYLFKGDCYRKLPKLDNTSVEKILGHDWEYALDCVAQDGVRLKALRHREYVNSARVPDGVSHIERFMGRVKSLEIPMSVKSLGMGCFEEEGYLKEIKIGNGIQEIPYCCFADSSIKTVRFSGYEQRISDEAFKMSELSGALVTGAKSIGKYAFSCTHITSLNLPNIEEIDIYAFEYCSQLKKIKFGDSLKVIDAAAFRDCTKLEEVEFSASTLVIGKSAFKDCKKLKEVRVASTTNIEKDAFPSKCKIIRY